MKNIISFISRPSIIAMLAVGLFLTACNDDLLNPVPETVFSSASVFDTPQRIEQQANGLYAFIKSGQFYGGRFVVYQDIRGEDFLNETTNGVTGLQTWNHTVVASTNEVTNLWGAAYAAINGINVFIAGLDANKDKINDPGLIQSYTAEARFLRGLCYYSLLTLYARPYADGAGSKLGLPLRLQAEVAAGNNDLARSSVAEIYSQILADLDFAESNLPATNSSDYNNVVRAHKNSAIALKTRVLLSMGRYADVVTEANKIVSPNAPFTATSGVPHALEADITDVFSSPYLSKESIFSMPFTENNLPGTQNGLGSYYNPGPRGIGDYSLNPDGIIGTVTWTQDDARRSFIFDNPENGKPYLNKFPTGPQHLDYVPVIRYAEVLLNLAEASARANGVNQRAVDLLNAVRGRSDAATQFVVGDFPSADDLINAILLERRIELLGEGFRSIDLLRLLQPIPGKANVNAVNPGQSEYIWPIPQSELATNKLMEPNP
jgi:starch-binding outer membrane protein, SusD/RagB family